MEKWNKDRKIYMDVTNLMQVNFITGIQRVVREIALFLLRKQNMRPVLLRYLPQEQTFAALQGEDFVQCFQEESLPKDKIRIEKRYRLEDMEPGEIFLDMDSVWHAPWKRMDLYPLLKNRGLKIAVFFHDIIPLLWPEYVDEQTTMDFLGYLAAVMQCADLLISSTQANITYMQDAMKKAGVQRQIPCAVAALGMDFAHPAKASDKIRREVREAAESGDYALMVGTVEARKNHRLILDAFESRLFADGMKLVIAGKIGWNIGDLEQRIRSHPELGKKLFFIEKATDAEIDLLYQHSYLLAFPSFAEGYGLPLVEACARRVPVITSGHPVLREVGGDFCEYIDPRKPEEFIACVEKYRNHPENYREWKHRLEQYHPATWQECGRKIADAICDTFGRKSPYAVSVPEQLNQLVILTARAEDLLASLPYVEYYMPFITELVLACPDFTMEEVRENYKGRLKITYITDAMLLADAKLPADHAGRNMFLRARLLRREEVHDVFLMGDDDYRPLRPITPEYYIRDGKYIGRYCHDLVKWRGAQGGGVSFDQSMFRARDFTTSHNYPTYLFDAHMPQVIDRRVYREVLERYPEIENKSAASEWNGYFNYMLAEYPEMLRVEPYAVLNWPGYPQDWEGTVKRPEAMFENYYEGVYEEVTPYGQKGQFAGLQRDFNEQSLAESEEKERRVRAQEAKHDACRQQYAKWQKEYRETYGEDPVFAVTRQEDDSDPKVIVPEKITLPAGDFVRQEIRILLQDCKNFREPERTPGTEWRLTWEVYRGDRMIGTIGTARFHTGDTMLEALLMLPEEPGEYRVEWNLFTEHKRTGCGMILECI